MALSSEDRKWLQEIIPDASWFDEPMARHTTLRVGGPAEVLVRPRDIGQLRSLVTGAEQRGLPVLVVGRGSNLLVRDGGIEGMVIDLSAGFRTIGFQGPPGPGGVCRVAALAGARLAALCRFAISRGLAGIEFALGIPGSVGGAIAMNAGTAAGSMADVLEAVTVLTPAGRIRRLAARSLVFGYRKLSLPPDVVSENRSEQTLILGGSLLLQPVDARELKVRARHLVQARRAAQPLKQPSAGSFFKNPPGGQSAGQLIDAAGFKGACIGGAAVSRQHANFIVNRGQATAADILGLIGRIQQRVSARFGIRLEPEVVIVGRGLRAPKKS